MNWRVLVELLRPSVWWLIVFPLIFLPPIYLLRRWMVGALLAILVCLISAYLAWEIVPQDELLRFLGRPIRFDHISAYVIALLCLVTAGLFFVSLNVPQGWSFYPLGLLILTLFTAAIINRHLGIIALIIEIVVLLSVFIIQGGRLGSIRAALRFLVMMTLAVPLFLLAAWQIDQYRLNLDNAPFLSQAALLVGGGFSLWLGVAPLHGWLSSIAAEAKSGIAAFVFITFPAVATLILLHLLESSPWLADIPRATEIMILAGLFTAVVGGGFASVQRAFGPLMGYAALFDLGASLIALGLRTELGQMIVIFSILVRASALVLIAASSAALEFRAEGDVFQQVRGLAKSLPLPTIGLIAGGLTLAGAPFTAGFVARWLLLQSLASIDPRWPLLILLGSLGVAIGYIRGLSSLIDPAPPRIAYPQQWGLNLIISGLVLFCLGLGFFPQLVLETVRELARSI